MGRDRGAVLAAALSVAWIGIWLVFFRSPRLLAWGHIGLCVFALIAAAAVIRARKESP